MKKKKILNITLLTSLLLLSACSNNQDKLTKKSSSKYVSVYSILGITQASNHFSKYKEHLSPDITYISYRKRYPMENRLKIIEKIEQRAKSFLGVPYVWGATGPSKFDCSGFTQWVYRDVGINIPRVSKEQARVGEFIEYNNLQRGDMVFFDTKKNPTGRVNHVGIYLGNGDFIHASSSGKSVVIYNFNKKKFYKKRFLWGRRVIMPNLHYASN